MEIVHFNQRQLAARWAISEATLERWRSEGTVAMTRLDTIWDQLFPAEQTRIVKLRVEKMIVGGFKLEVQHPVDRVV